MNGWHRSPGAAAPRHVEHGAATPVTPSHSPPPSLHSTSLHSASSRAHTPIHSLSLHDYRKQQASPSTPDSTGGRRVRRKAAATRLNTLERVPPLPSARPTAPSPSSSEPTRRGTRPLFPGLQVPSVRSLPALPQHRPLSPLHDITNPVDRPQDALQLALHHRHLGKTLRSSKRLPRPENIGVRRPPPPSPICSDPSSLDLLSTAGLTNTSTFTLSKFPFPAPPQSRPLADEDAPLHVWPPDSRPEDVTRSLPDTPPATPAVVHYRGASFDVVNPHRSLYLCNLETPAELEIEHDDYFDRSSLEQLLPDEMAVPSPPSSEDASTKAGRPLYNNFHSAYSNIARKSTPPQFELPVAPTAAMLRTTTNGYANLDYMPSTAQISSPITNNKKMTRTPSIIDRARDVFRRKDKGATSPSQFIQEDGQELKQIPIQRMSTAYRSSLGGAPYTSAPVVGQSTDVEVPRASADTWESVSDGVVGRHSQLYDKASIYPQEQEDFRSSSLYFGPLSDNRRSVPFGVKQQITDYSGEVAFPFAFGESFQNTRRQSFQTEGSHYRQDTPRQSFLSQRLPRPFPKAGDHTLGSIYDQYGNLNESDATVSGVSSLEDLVGYDGDDDTIRISSLGSLVPPSSPPRMENRTSGLSQFDFGLDQSRHGSNGESSVSSPVTPQEGAFPAMPTITRASAGAPPSSPLPLQPATEFQHPRQTLPRGSTDFFSNRASSYGDTRKLLDLSGNMKSPAKRISQISENGSFRAGDRLPDSPLASFIDRHGSQRGSPPIEQAWHLSPGHDSNDTVGQAGSKRLSQMSVESEISVRSQGSNLSGKIYVMGPAADGGPGSENGPQFSFEDDVEALSSEHKGLRKQAMVTNAERHSGGFTSDPSAIPAMWMRKASPGPQMKLRKVEVEPPRNDSPATMRTENTEGDWETIGASTSKRDIHDDSFGADEYSFNETQLHHREESNDSVSGRHPQQKLRRKRSFDDLMPTRTNTNPWRNKPKTSMTEDSSPFNSSPTELSTIPRFPRDSEMSFLRNSKHLRQSQRAAAGATPPERSYRFELSPDEEAAFLAYGPSDEVLIEDPSSPLARRSQARYSTRGTTTTNDFAPQSSRSEMADRRNSFDKYTVLGPKANLTGTPNGTDMREAGSSTVATGSSPAAGLTYHQIFGSSPMTPGNVIPSRQFGTPFWSPTEGRMIYEGPSPSGYVSSPLARSSNVGSPTNRSSLIPPAATRKVGDIEKWRTDAKLSRVRLEQSERTRSMASSSQATLPGRRGPILIPRNSIRSQTAPRDLQLRHADSMTFGSERSEFANIVRPISSTTAQPLTGDVLYRNSPHLMQFPRADSSTRVTIAHKKKKISWAIFACTFWFPPLALCLFLGKFDTLMYSISKGEIVRVSRFQKNAALLVCVIECIIVIILPILWRVGIFG